tara:strand:- start:1845 stop:2057 length:213 start_codon:yes stop_codon:yes gene_type:complete
MTKKDYELIARIITTTMREVRDSGIIENSEQAKLVSSVMANYLLRNVFTTFIKEYENFDIDKFKNAIQLD